MPECFHLASGECTLRKTESWLPPRQDAFTTAPMNLNGPTDHVKPVLNIALWVFVVALAFLYVFITFRGLNSPAAMDQAQIARELARGHGYTTHMIRPSSVNQLETHGRAAAMDALPETYHPPLQPVIWAAVFKGIESWWDFDHRTGMVYRLDRVIACMGACWFLITLLMVHGIARRMFDRTLANFSVLALVLSRPLWDLVTTGGPKALLLMLVTACAWSLTIFIKRAVEGEPVGLMPLLLALCCTALVMTNLMTLWIVLGVVIAVALLLPENRGSLVLIALLPALAFGGWLAHNAMTSGEVLGTAKATMQSILSPSPDSVLMRDYESTTPPVMLAALMRKVNDNLSAQVENLVPHLLSVVPAVLFFLSLLHRFRREEVNKTRWAVGIVWVSAILGMGFIGLPDGTQDDNQLHALLVPAMTVFGLAGLAVLWARFNPGKGGVWTHHGFAILAIVIGGWPMIMGLTTDLRIGLFFKNQMMQPDYRAAAMSGLREMVKKDEMLVSDAPWAVAWYVDRPCLWLPRTREQFTALHKKATDQKHDIAGFVVTTVCTKGTNFATQFTGPYAEWTDLIARGPVIGLGSDLAERIPALREYPKMLPLGGSQLADGRIIYTVNFYADRERWGSMLKK